ncbi:MAG: DUF1376 domain-containing protein [Pseudomonadota bacterium]
MNYYEHHIGDYDSATAHLSVLEDGVYFRLLRVYYRTEQPIPADVKQACRLIRAVTKQERDTVQSILQEFFELMDDGWHNRRCDEEIARFRDKQAKAKASANARWNAQRPHREGNAVASPDAMRTHSEGNAPRARPQTPDTNHQRKRASTSHANAADFFPDITPQVLADFEAVRKAKRAGPITATVANGIKREAEKAGLTVQQALEMCCENGWQSIKASWESVAARKDTGAASRVLHADDDLREPA